MAEEQVTDGSDGSGNPSPHAAESIIDELRGVSHRAESALREDELQAIDRAISMIEDAAGIETGEQIMESPVTGEAYRVTRWVEQGDGFVALQKEAINGE